MRHTPGLSVFDGATHSTATDIRLGSQCDTPRPTATPLREGMARQRSIDNQNDAAAHPLSERGAAKRRGVSHYESKHITMDNTNMNNFEKDFF